VVSFTVKWTATGDPTHFSDPVLRYRGDLSEATAQLEFTARSGHLEYTSAPLSESTTDLAWLGTESNGSFF